MNAYFASIDHMNEILSRDPEMRKWHQSPERPLAERVCGLLTMEMHERNVLGVALEGNELRHDVAQVTVSFSKHRLVDPTGAEGDTRRLLKRRAFDHLLTLALAGMAESHGERGDLKHERDLLRSKLASLAAGHWGFGNDAEAGTDEPSPDPRALQQRISEIDAQLSTLSTGLLKEHLDILAGVLGQAAQNLHGERSPLNVDRQGVKQMQSSDAPPQITLTTLHNSAGKSLVIRLVTLAQADLPAPPDFLREAQRFLG